MYLYVLAILSFISICILSFKLMCVKMQYIDTNKLLLLRLLMNKTSIIPQLFLTPRYYLALHIYSRSCCVNLRTRCPKRRVNKTPHPSYNNRNDYININYILSRKSDNSRFAYEVKGTPGANLRRSVGNVFPIHTS